MTTGVRLTLLLILIVGLAWLVGSPQVGVAGTPTFSNGLIAYRDDPGISTRHADGTHPDVLIRTRQNTTLLGPDWSPDGEMLAFARHGRNSRYSINILQLDTSETVVAYRETRRFTTVDQPDWSPDGSLIAFETHNYNTGVARIMVVGIDGSDPHNVGPGYVRTPAWSPDGSQIAFTRAVGTDVTVSNIWVMEADGGNRVPLTTDGRSFGPTWSPDGSMIGFGRVVGSALIANDLFVMDADGGNVVRLTNTQRRHEFGATWAPDGTVILFERTLGHASASDLFTVEPDGTNVTRLTHTRQVYESDPDWQPVTT